jgi:hypothetical protein
MGAWVVKQTRVVARAGIELERSREEPTYWLYMKKCLVFGQVWVVVLSWYVQVWPRLQA